MSSESASDRKKRMTTAVSIFNRLSGSSQRMRSRGSSLMSKFQRDLMGFHDIDTLRCREWLLLLVEVMLACSWNSFLWREKSEHTMEARGIDPRQDALETLFWLGWASVGNITAGQLMDSVTGSYVMALFNVATHFTLASIFLIGEIVHETSSEDVYATLRSHVFLWTVPPIKAVNFARYVYAMDQVAGRSAPFLIHYTFLFTLSTFVGNFTFTILKDTTPSPALLAAIAFCFNGTVLFTYAYLLRPQHGLSAATPPGVALKVWGVLFTALKNRRKLKRKIIRQDWLEYAENKYDKGQINRSRRLFRLFLMASPTAGFLLFTTNRDMIFKEFYSNLNISGTGVSNVVSWAVSTISFIVLLLVEYAVLPSLQACKIKVNFMKRFLLGYSSLVLAVFLAAILSSLAEKVPIRRVVGTLRVYNTMAEGNVTFKSMQEDFTQLSFVVLHKEAVVVNFQRNEMNLFRMNVKVSSPTVDQETSSNVISYTKMFSAEMEEVIQYVTITPATIFRVPGSLPIKQGPPGQNDPSKARCFIASLIQDRVQSVHVINVLTHKRITIEVSPGEVVTFQVEEGVYVLQYTSSLIEQRTATFGTGGLYGIYLFLGFNTYEIDVDTVMEENTVPAMTALAVSVPLTIARGIGQVALNAFVYRTTPEGLKGLAYGFYEGCANLTAWFILIGFYSWHHYITPNILLYYTIIAAVSFLFCLVLLIKFQNHYKM